MISGGIGALGLVVVTLACSCSQCSVLNRSEPFHGFLSDDRKEFQVLPSGGALIFHSNDAGDLNIDVPAGTFSSVEKIEILTTQDPELDEDFQTNPATSQGVKRLPGELRIRSGQQPAKSISICYDRGRIAKMAPLVYEVYEGENEILSYFTEPNRHSAPAGPRECLEIEKNAFSELNNEKGQPEAVILFVLPENSK